VDGIKDLVFEYKGGSYAIPYASVTSLEFGQKAGRRVALAVLISPALLFSEKKQHFLTIGFSNEAEGNEVVVFELSKGIFQSLLPSLEARTGRRAAIDMASSGGPDDEWSPAHSSEVRHGISAEAAVPLHLRLVNVTVTSSPSGATIAVERQIVGKTPATFKMQPGEWRVRLTLAGFQQWDGKVMVEPGKPTALEAALTAAPK
jgi:hypothetical protein